MFGVLRVQNLGAALLDAGCVSHRQAPHKFIETSVDTQLLEVAQGCPFVTCDDEGCVKPTKGMAPFVG